MFQNNGLNMGNSIPKPNLPKYRRIVEVPDDVLIGLCSINRRCPKTSTHLLMMSNPVRLNFGSFLFPSLSDDIYECSAVEKDKNCPISGRRIKGLVPCSGTPKIPDYIKDLLESSIINNDLRSLNKWFEHDGPADVTLRDGTTLMYKAAEHGKSEIILRLQEQGASVSFANRTGEHRGIFPLYVAAEKGHLAAVQALLGLNARADQLQERGSARGISALFVAARFGHADIAELLLTSGGANVNLIQEYGSPFKGLTAIFIASCNGHEQTLIVLANHGALVNRIITEAMFEKKVTIQHNGANRTESRVFHSEYQGMGALFIAAKMGHARCVSVLLEGYGAIVNGLPGESCHGEEHTPIFIAVLHQKRVVVEVLLAHGARLKKTEVDILKKKDINSSDLLYEADTIHYMARDIVKAWLSKQPPVSLLTQSNQGEEIRKRLFLVLYKGHREYLSKFKLPTSSYREFVEQISVTDLSPLAVNSAISRLSLPAPFASAPPAEKTNEGGAFMAQYMGATSQGEQPVSPPPEYTPGKFKFK